MKVPRRAIAFTAGTVAGVLAVAGGAVAAPADHAALPAANLVLACDAGTVYTGISGELRFVGREGASAGGNERFGGTVSLDQVLVTDGSNTYRAIGAAIFGGGFTAETGAVSDRGMFHIQVLGTNGPVAAVRITARLLDDGTVWFNDHGDCSQPGQ
jgi:hypothetical protein